MSDTTYELQECLACASEEVELVENEDLWRCNECGSTVTAQGLEALVGELDDDDDDGVMGPLDELY